MYTRIADSVSKPLILYNVPSRTGMNIEPATYAALADHPNIVAIKEASADIGELEGKIARFGDYFNFYSGCDELILPTYALGGIGVISAVANVIPSKIATLCQLCAKNERKEAINLASELSSFIREMFAEVNPIPVKCALSLMGLCENELRLPLTPSTRETEIKRLMPPCN